jgi:DNA-binding winged helix-turn-helix (wHTH) protein
MNYFPPFRFDSRTGSLWLSGRPVHLSRKAAELLGCLLASPGALVTHEQLLTRVWPETHVQPENVKTVIHELRTVLNDPSHAPKFIRSDPGRGYTFVADVTVGMPPLFSDDQDAEEALFVGRETELDVLNRHMQAAADRCEPQLVLIEGGRGVGKTTLCDRFARQVRRRHTVRISLATGVEVWGTVERYSVLIEALGSLARQYPHFAPAAIARRAPGWLAKLAAGSSPAVPSDDQPSDERLAREFMAVLDELTVDVPLLLILEDLQWSDAATFECLRLAARAQVPGRVCIVATFSATKRQPSVIQLERLGRDLQTCRSGSLIRLRPFDQHELIDCLQRRFGPYVAEVFGPPLFDAGGGNPLLATMTMDSLVRIGALHRAHDGWQLATAVDEIDAVLRMGLADGLQCQLDRLSADDYRLLEAGAAIGTEFSAESVAEAIGNALPMPVSRRLMYLDERHLFVEAIDHDHRTPPSTPGLAFRFRHPLTSELLSDRAPLKGRLEAIPFTSRAPARRRA